ncbi:MAG: tRNA (guanosine(46)-N7)-methyltransferase TrmB [Saprospiraceae bacterium]|nr:tRNA (guanosine(46)-N7)-methyltransferase TrmB [Saprospiraceae bacterium]
MARRNKLKKFNDLLSFSNVYENYDPTDPKLMASETEEVDLKGKWKSDHFKNDNPLVLELACGRGEYSLALARTNPSINYIGVDIKGARIWQGATIANEENLDNVAFLRTRIEQIGLFFEKGEVDEIWITFPDPFLRNSKANRRLTSMQFLNRYKEILKSNGIIHLKTDDPTLYEFSQEQFAECPFVEVLYDRDDIYSQPLDFDELIHKTYYEKQHLEKKRKIKYIKVKLSK